MVDTKIENNYKVIKELGKGAYGVVSSAKCLKNDKKVALKKVMRVFDKKILTKRCLREIKLLKHFNGHDNIIKIYDGQIENEKFNELHLVIELMEADLHSIIRSKQSLTDAHYQYFIYQLTSGMAYIHSANVIHRDLKPGNLLVNANCELKICDFGLARAEVSTTDKEFDNMTEYVATRWYRSPEVMLTSTSYSKALDIWSIGCIFAELLGGKPLFKGRDYVDQLNKILEIIGTPEIDDLKLCSQRGQQYINGLPKMKKVKFETLFPKASPGAIDLLNKTLTFNPDKRLTAEEILNHPYLKNYFKGEIKTCDKFDFEFEKVNDQEEIRKLIIEEIESIKKD